MIQSCSVVQATKTTWEKSFVTIAQSDERTLRSRPNPFHIFCQECPEVTKKTRWNSSVKKIKIVRKIVKEKAIPANYPKSYRVHFAWANHEITADRQTNLNKWLKLLPKTTHFRIIGYTDNTVSKNPTIKNSTLAKRRVSTVDQFMKHQGYKNVRSKSKPMCCYIASNSTATGRKQNRRVEIEIIRGKSR
jgi:outer membrane protein OmpA-like peptidoglycan-associated protein